MSKESIRSSQKINLLILSRKQYYNVKQNIN